MRSIIALCILLVAPAELIGQTASVEADHIFVFVSPGGRAEADALRKLGFAVDSAVTKHVGQGTASRSVLFGNAYLEMIWVDSTVAVAEDAHETAAALQRGASWRSTGASPFGLGLRKLAGPDEFGVPATRYSAEWMEEGAAIVLLKQQGEPSAFDVFVVPSYMAVPAWIGQVEQQAPALLQHPNAAKTITEIDIHGPVAHHPQAARTLSIPRLRVTEALEPILFLELDGGSAGEAHDLRPLMPVIIRR